MKKPQYALTLATAEYMLVQAAAGETFSDPSALRKATEVVRYWAIQRAKRAA